MTMTEEKSFLNFYAKDLFNALQLLRVCKSERVFSSLMRFFTDILIMALLSANFFLILSEVVDLKNIKDARELATRLGPIFLHLTGITKWCFCMSNINQITNLIDSLKHCHHLTSQICQNSKDQEKLHEEMEIARKRVRLFIYLWPALGMSGALHYCCNPLSLRIYEIYIKHHDSVNVSKILPIPGCFPWDVDHYFGYSYILQILGVMGCCVGSVSYDQLYVSTLIIVCSLLKHLMYSLQCKIYDQEMIRGKIPDFTKFEVRLKNCAVQYAEVLEHLQELEKVGSPCMFVQCVQNIVVLCLSSFEAATLQITSEAECIMKLLTMAEFVSAVTIQLFFFCFVATYVKSLGLLVADSAYACEWVSSFDYLRYKSEKCVENHRVKYLVLLITIRAQRPILLTGGPFYILSLETFKAIIGLAVSNAVILSQLYEAQ